MSAEAGIGMAPVPIHRSAEAQERRNATKHTHTRAMPGNPKARDYSAAPVVLPSSPKSTVDMNIVCVSIVR